jgi:hypothetical protein
MQADDLGGRSCEIVVYINQCLSKVFHESLSDSARSTAPFLLGLAGRGRYLLFAHPSNGTTIFLKLE